MSTDDRSTSVDKVFATIACLDLERPSVLKSSTFPSYHFPHAPRGKPIKTTSFALVRLHTSVSKCFYMFTFSAVASSRHVLEASCRTVASTTNARPSLTNIRSGLYSFLMVSLMWGSLNTIQSLFFASSISLSQMWLCLLIRASWIHLVVADDVGADFVVRITVPTGLDVIFLSTPGEKFSRGVEVGPKL